MDIINDTWRKYQMKWQGVGPTPSAAERVALMLAAALRGMHEDPEGFDLRAWADDLAVELDGLRDNA